MANSIRQCLDNHPAPNKTFNTALNQGTVTATDISIEKVGVSARKIDYRFHQAKSPNEVVEVAENLVERADYLLEPLAIIEQDAEHSHVQIRSQKPTSDESSRRYYEMNVDGSGVTLERYGASGGTREAEDIHLTRETFARLCEDLDEASNRVKAGS